MYGRCECDGRLGTAATDRKLQALGALGLLCKLLEALGDLAEDVGNVHVAEAYPQLVLLAQRHLPGLFAVGAYKRGKGKEWVGGRFDAEGVVAPSL